MSKEKRPFVGFHFRVDFVLPMIAKPQDVFFKSVEGIKASLEVEENAQAPIYSFNRYKPTGRTFSDLVLKRGMLSGSMLINYFEVSLFAGKIVPIPLIVSLLDEKHVPAYAWMFMNAFPVSWETSGFDAEKNEILVETITMKYGFYKQVRMMGPSGSMMLKGLNMLQNPF